MSYSIYDASVPPMIRMLENLSNILDKAVAQAKEKNIDLKTLLEARLAPDMHPLPRQIQIATDSAKGGAARLADIEVPSYADTETTFPELKERIAKTVAFLKSVPQDKFAGAESRKVEMKLPNRTLEFSGKDFLNGMTLPNFFFHVTTAYDILRHKGIEIGKMDFLGGV